MTVRATLPVDQIQYLWNRGDKVQSIAARFHVSTGSISNLMNRHRELFPRRNASFKHLTKSQTARMLRQHRSGKTQTEIAKSLGVTQSAISYALKRNGF